MYKTYVISEAFIGFTDDTHRYLCNTNYNTQFLDLNKISI